VKIDFKQAYKNEVVKRNNVRQIKTVNID